MNTHTNVHTLTSIFLASALNTSLREWKKASVKDTLVLTVSLYDTLSACGGIVTMGVSCSHESADNWRYTITT